MTAIKARRMTAAMALLLAIASSSAVAQLAPAPTTPPAFSPANEPSLQPLLEFNESSIKFPLRSLMDVLRDKSHEGWVLAAYPDPNTSRPLIGAGFSLDVQAADHPQLDPLNPHPFLEPSSAQLWQAAHLDSDQLDRILDQFDRNLALWAEKGYRRRIKSHRLPPQLSEEEAMRLLRISAIQAVVNARAYCRSFDQLTASQQMGLSQLVFQMGVNLEQFVDFLSTLNGDDRLIAWLQTEGENAMSPPQISPPPVFSSHWQTVQSTLIDSQWARRYSLRAATVIAMFDPEYALDPSGKVQKVDAILRPPATRRRKSSPARTLRAANHVTARPHTNKSPSRKHTSAKSERS